MMSHYKQACEKYSKVVKWKRQVFGEYSEFVFDEEGKPQGGVRQILLGSRPHESEEDFVLFLDDVFAICFSKQADEEAANQTAGATYPLLKTFAAQIQLQEIESDAHKAVTQFQRKEVIKHAREKLHKNTKRTAVLQIATPPALRKAASTDSPTRPRPLGLFRSQSVTSLPRSLDTVESSSLFHDEISNIQTSTPRSKKKKGRKLRDYASMQNLAEVGEMSYSADVETSAGEDPLAVPILEPWMLDNFVFGERYSHMDNLLSWLYRWTTKHYPALAGLDDGARLRHADGLPDGAPLQRGLSVIRLRLNPLLVLYSLWQLDYNYYK